MAVKTTKIQCNQDVDVRGKVDIEGKVTCGGDVEVDGGIYAEGKDLQIGRFNYDGNNKGIFNMPPNNLCCGVFNARKSIRSYFEFQDTDITCTIFPNTASWTTFSMLDLYKNANNKQDVLYRHCVTIKATTDNGTRKVVMSFTAESEKNLPIDSIQDLITVFGNTSLTATGLTYAESNGSVNTTFIFRIEVKSSANDTQIVFMTFSTGDIVSIPFTQMFGATGFTITDTVTAM